MQLGCRSFSRRCCALSLHIMIFFDSPAHRSINGSLRLLFVCSSSAPRCVLLEAHNHAQLTSPSHVSHSLARFQNLWWTDDRRPLLALPPRLYGQLVKCALLLQYVRFRVGFTTTCNWQQFYRGMHWFLSYAKYTSNQLWHHAHDAAALQCRYVCMLQMLQICWNWIYRAKMNEVLLLKVAFIQNLILLMLVKFYLQTITNLYYNFLKRSFHKIKIKLKKRKKIKIKNSWCLTKWGVCVREFNTRTKPVFSVWHSHIYICMLDFFYQVRHFWNLKPVTIFDS